MKQLNELAELAWKLGIKISSVEFPLEYKNEWHIDKIETDFMPLNIVYK